MTTIKITLEGGIVQEIEGIPAGIIIEVQDFDVQGIDTHLHEIHTNDHGHKYTSTTWGPEWGKSNT